MTFIAPLLLASAIFSLIASFLHLSSIARGKNGHPILGIFFTWSVTSFWVILAYFVYQNGTIGESLLAMIDSPDFRRYVGILAGVLTIIEFVPYIYSIVKGKTKPERASWSIWALVTAIGLASFYSSGARETIWMLVAYVAATITVSLLSIRYGVGGWTKFDRYIIFSCALCLVVWWLTGSPLIALAMTITIDALAALPTIRKTYYHPESEDRLAWVISLSAGGLNLLAVEKWDFAHASYPIYLFIMIGIVTELILRPRHRRHRAHILEEKRV
ncbi:MAG: hypothetical protein A3B23_00430 [Candidatus Colwellbacteria bacterium RIFCSPLOWO2_01_FULL_48_10]|uniref:Uncharacterized protein n=2 Tax=Bacteria candidate phyla TaxID=1783234 RepID=A0A1F5P2X8_9BACT|nr:MAG: hypothetical protein A2846_04645 [Candidatus Doudnabacteria bacterium RIFCSPHIGHO2_01_FULL_49_9]OGY59172.1 MAG: hypothetical protein A3B23_00430 [Candidatus Colwellbacteria bacterium RIFCSPLOWO2_01_FULL_48_10]